ncbi:MAG: DUF4136 domain-containing protein [Candidatus Sulfomarinibacteraceae bacterium]
MLKHTGLVVLLVLAAASAAAMDIYVDYDRSGRFSWYKTWAWAETEETSLKGHNDLMHSRIKNAIEHYISQGRLIEDTENPQLYITYHAVSSPAMKVNPVSFGVGFGGGWAMDPYWGGVGVSTASAATYEQGTLIIDIWEAETKKLVWRGVAVDAFVDDPKKADKKINQAIEKMIKKWRKMKPGL